MSERHTLTPAAERRVVTATPAPAARPSVPGAGMPVEIRALLSARPRVTRRGVQVALGVIWLLVGLLQLQTYMYSHAFVTQVLEPSAAGQPSFIGGPITAIARFYGRDVTLWNTLAAEIQCAIGLGLILSRRTVRPALAFSFVWAPIVWWFGEGFGLLTSNAEPSALMGAPGAVIIYAIVGLAVWPTPTSKAGGLDEDGPINDRLAVWPTPTSKAGGLDEDGPINDRLASSAWSLLWVVSAVLWCLNINRSKNATHDMLAGMAANSPHWLAGWQNWAANASRGHGAVIALVLAAVSVLVALGVWSRRLRLPVLGVGIGVSLAYWVLGQSLGGPFWNGQSTDVNAAPLFILLAVALVPGARRIAVPRTAALSPEPIRTSELDAGAIVGV